MKTLQLLNFLMGFYSLIEEKIKCFDAVAYAT